jgi:protein-S-isoprenylcysteine O-methyltransferase Ste14
MDEAAVEAAVIAYASMALLGTIGRAGIFWLRHRRRPVAGPRNGVERLFHAALLLVVAAMVLIGVARLADASLYDRLGSWRHLESPATFAAACVLSFLGWSLVLIAGSQMRASWRFGIPEERTELVTRGIFQWVRNPIYDGLGLALLGFALLLPGWLTAALVVLYAALIPRWVGIEEGRQLELHGDAFRRYCDATGRFLPRLSRSPR